LPSETQIGLIWAQTTAGVIGRDGGIPWRIPEDTAHFVAVTMGCPVVMGRKTWDSLPARFRPLSGRRNIVVTRQPDWAADGATRAGSLQDAMQMSTGDQVWIMGGGQLYAAAMPLADRLVVTEIDADIDGDSFAPAIDDRWAAADTPWLTSEPSGLRYRFLEYLPVR
jgi:dihydrofolate reductase